MTPEVKEIAKGQIILGRNPGALTLCIESGVLDNARVTFWTSTLFPALLMAPELIHLFTCKIFSHELISVHLCRC